MTNRHFATLGDVWKHLPLAEILRLNPPRHYWETHAGSAIYSLTRNSLPQFHGVMHFLSHASTEPSLAHSTYLKILLGMPGLYPGSPTIATSVLNASADYMFCDIDPESVNSLRQSASCFNDQVMEKNGVDVIAGKAKGLIDDPLSVVVHIDPYDPHERYSKESMTPLELAASLASDGLRVFYWYGYDTLDRRGWALEEISRLTPSMALWCGDILVPSTFVYPERFGAWGCGIVLANMTEIEIKACTELGEALERVYSNNILLHNKPEKVTFSVIT